MWPSDRFSRVWTVALFAVGAGLCFVPLFNLLGYEFAFAAGVPVAFCAGACGVRARRVEYDAPYRAWGRASRRALVLALVPLLPITLNAMRVQNCDYLEGLAFYGVLTLSGAIVAAGWGVAIGRIARRRGVWLFVVAAVTTLVWTLAGIWFEPPVDAFHPLFGYYPGPIYDPVVRIGEQLVWSRIEDLSAAAALVALSGATRDLRDGALPLILALATACVHAVAVAKDVHRDAEHIAESLGGVYTTEHARVVYPGEWSSARVERMGWELEFDYAELRTFFGFDTTRPITVYIYPDLATKKRLMGAANTRVAKPWQWAFSVHAPKIGDDVTMHEMAHVFSAEIANPPHHLSLGPGGLPNMAQIEGLAVAATWNGRRLDRHQWSAAMRRLDLAPPVDTLLAPSGFITSYQGVAYTVCGSISRHFVDTYGRAALAEAYRTGDFALAAGRPLDALATAWGRFVDEQPLPPGAMEQARATFDRPSIFGRVCARDIAQRRRRATEALRAKRHAESLALVEGILGDTPGAVRERLARIQLLFLLDRADDARVAATALSGDAAAGALGRARAREWLADLDALARAPSASARYATALGDTFDRGARRRIWVKRAALSEPEAVARLTLDHLTRQATAETRRARVDAIVAARPQWPVGRYLRGRVRVSDDSPLEGLRDLAAAEAGLESVDVRLETRRLMAATLFQARCYEASAVIFDSLGERDDLILARAETHGLRRWARRARFFATRAGAAPDTCNPLIDIISGRPEDGAAPGNRAERIPVEPNSPEKNDGDSK